MLMQEDLNPFEWMIVHTMRHVRLLMHSNTFWLCVALVIFTAIPTLPESFVAAYPRFKDWLPTIIGLAALAVKIFSNRDKGGRVSD